MQVRVINLKLEEQFFYLTTLPFPFVMLRYIQLPLGVAPAGNMCHRKIDKLLQGMTNVFCITDDILIAWIDDLGRYYDAALNKVLRICREANLKLNKDKCLFRHRNIPFIREIILQNGMRQDPRNIQAVMNMPPSRCKKRAIIIPGYSQLRD